MATKTKPKAKAPAKKDDAARKRSAASQKAAATRKRKAAEQKKAWVEQATLEELQRVAARPDLVAERRDASERVFKEGYQHGADDLSVEFVDGARALLILGKEVRLVSQADLQAVRQRIEAGIQSTY